MNLPVAFCSLTVTLVLALLGGTVEGQQCECTLQTGDGAGGSLRHTKSTGSLVAGRTPSSGLRPFLAVASAPAAVRLRAPLRGRREADGRDDGRDPARLGGCR